jgi:DNA polymerase III subunit epsilon
MYVVLDTETTGLHATEGHRVVEIGCVELNEHLVQTGNKLHLYLNPGRSMSPDSVRITGLTDKFLRNKPPFKVVVDRFLEFIRFKTVIAHNAAFDVRFINAELERLRLPPLDNEVIDTVALAREVKKGGRHNLDALCRHFGIDNSQRVTHGALLDAEILAEVYVHLKGGRQTTLELSGGGRKGTGVAVVEGLRQRSPVLRPLNEEDLAAHQAFLVSMGSKEPLIWSEYLQENKLAA